jgi:D-glycero-alpha-D-manno-heptose-7-phosphate kinase
LAGAGGGGFLFFLVPKEKQAAVRSALSPLLEVKFRFEDEGSKIIYLMH